jgi:hypothetical protein
MKFVQIYGLTSGKQVVIATARLKHDTVEITGNKRLIAALITDGIPVTRSPGAPVLYPRDGLAFLEALAPNFHSGYINATVVQDDGEAGALS